MPDKMDIVSEDSGEVFLKYLIFMNIGQPSVYREVMKTLHSFRNQQPS